LQPVYEETFQAEAETGDDAEHGAEVSSPVDYHEVYYSEETGVKKDTKRGKPMMESWRRSSWEDAPTIEKQVDHMDRGTKSAPPAFQISEVDKKVDRLLLKRRKK
jgi:hypothetical protein